MGAVLKLPRAVHVLCMGGFLVSAGMMIIPFLAFYLSTHLGLGVEFATYAFTAHGIGQIGGATLGGSVADRYGRRPTMIGGLLVAAVLALALCQVTSPAAILLTVACLSFSVASYRPASQAMIADLVPPSDRPTAYSLMYAAGNLGFAVASGAGGWLAGRSYTLLFVADAIASVLYAGIIYALVKETRPLVKEPSEPRAEAAASGAAAYLRVLADRRFLVFSVATLAVSLVYTQAMSTLPLTMANAGLGVEQYGRVMAINGVLIVVLQLPVTAWFSRINRATMVAIGDVLVAIGFGATALCISQGHFALAVSIWTLGEIIHAAFKFSMVGDMAPVELRARYFGAYQGVFALANSFGPLIGGILLTRHGTSVLFGTTAALCLFAAALNFALRSAFESSPAALADGAEVAS